jgi:hypothetical protein
LPFKRSLVTRDIYAFVSELSGGFADEEPIPDEIVDELIVAPLLHPE